MTAETEHFSRQCYVYESHHIPVIIIIGVLLTYIYIIAG